MLARHQSSSVDEQPRDCETPMHVEAAQQPRQIEPTEEIHSSLQSARDEEQMVDDVTMTAADVFHHENVRSGGSASSDTSPTQSLSGPCPDLREDVRAMKGKLDEVLQELHSVKNILAGVKLTQGVSTKMHAKSNSTEVEEEDLKTALFKSGRSLSHLEAATDNCLVKAPGNNALHCKVCVPKFLSSIHVREGSTVFGVFKYDFSLGSSFDKSERIPMMFRNLKTAVQSHFSSKKHAEKSAAAQTHASVLQGRFRTNVQFRSQNES